MSAVVDQAPTAVAARLREALRLGSLVRPAKGASMDPDAVAARLRRVAELRVLCLALARRPSPPPPSI